MESLTHCRIRVLAIWGMAGLLFASAPNSTGNASLPDRMTRGAMTSVQDVVYMRYLHRHFHIPERTAKTILCATGGASRETGIPESVLLGVIATESSFNPRSENKLGAIGLMQVRVALHRAILPPGREWVIADNVGAGARILQRYLIRSGNLSRALQGYNGNRFDLLHRYSHRVEASARVFSARDEGMQSAYGIRMGAL